MSGTKLIAFLIICTLCFSACSSQEVTPEIESEPVVEEVAEPEVDPETLEIQEFLSKYQDNSERPVAVMIDNDDKNARPHAGLNEAYLIYEMVVEGGATRFMALYKSDDVAKIGPVRSSRHYFLDFVMENDAIYTHYGWSPKASSDISAFGINKINGVLGGDGSIFWREEKFKGDWHSAFTSMKNIKEMALAKGYASETTHKNSIKYSDKYFDLESEMTAADILLSYCGKYNTGYKYNPDTKLYEKTINGAPHVMQSGDTLTVKNVIVELIQDVSLGDGTERRDLKTAGSGKGYYFTNGKYEEITWSKASRKDNTVYTKTDGTPLVINPGKTIINIISPASGITIN